MIKVERGSPPAFFAGEEYRSFQRAVVDFYRRGGTRMTQEDLPWRDELDRYMNVEGLDALRHVFANKCAFTEVSFDDDDSAIESYPRTVLFRPPGDAIGLDESTSPEHYWWLITEWRNWYLASASVESLKGNRFPVIGERAEVPQEGPPFEMPIEEHLLLDPCSEAPGGDPVWHLAFDSSGVVDARDLESSSTIRVKRSRASRRSPGAHTISLLDLNREELVWARARAHDEAVRELSEVMASAGENGLDQGAFTQLGRIVSPERPFAAARRQAIAESALTGRLSNAMSSNDTQLLCDCVEWLVENLPDESAAMMLSAPLSQSSLQHLPPDARDRLGPLSHRVAEVFPKSDYPDRLLGLLSPEKVSVPGGGVVKKPQAVESGGQDRPAVSLSAEIMTIRIRNFRAIHDLELSNADLPSEQMLLRLEPEYGAHGQSTITDAHRWWTLLGENGSGKSSVLQAVGLALSGDEIDSVMKEAGLDWAQLHRRPPAGATESVEDGRVYLDFSDRATIDLRFNAKEHWWIHTITEPAPSDGGEEVSREMKGPAPEIHTFVRAYGATRLLQSNGDRRAKEDSAKSGAHIEAASNRFVDADKVRVANLFDPRAEVSDAKHWLLEELSESDFNVVAPIIGGLLHGDGLAIDQTLAGSTSETIDGDGSQPPPLKILDRNPERTEVTVAGVPLELASDGYRAVIAMVCDIMRGLGEGLSSMSNANGIVLIDEIGAHLHPRWRMSITRKLRRALPKVQFIVSTHEPLCLRGLQSKEVVRVTKHPKLGVIVEVVERSPSYYRVDQLLTSEFFGLDTTIDPDLERRFQHYYRLLAEPKKNLKPEDIEQLDELHAYLQKHARPALGHTRRDQLVYEQIDKYLVAEQQAAAEAKTREAYIHDRDARRAKALASVKDLWDRRAPIETSMDDS